MSLNLPPELEARIEARIAQYPAAHRRAAVLWLLHLLQQHCGCVGPEQVAWTAAKLGVRRIDVEGLVSFYPMFTPQPRGRFHLKVCRTLACELCGCRAIAAHLRQRLGIADGETTADGRFTLSAVECLAACGAGPVMMVNDELVTGLTPAKVDALLSQLSASDRFAAEPPPPLPPAHPRERRLLLANLAQPGYGGSLAEYQRAGGYTALRRALTLTPAAITQEVEASGLRGRGGAGFPAGAKWRFVDRRSGKPVYLICNADESEPGTFKDRVLIHHDPHLLLEGLLLAAYALGAPTGYLYIRGEFPAGAAIIERAIADARAANLLGPNILGRDFHFDIHLHRGAGAYICGEETGLIESLEGKRAYPRIKPPFPAAVGLFGCPTVVNNVETLCNLPWLVNHGGAAFAGLGVAGSTGTRLVGVSGPVRRPGLYEFEMGRLTLRELLDDVCGGLLPGHRLRGVMPGGSSMPVLTPAQLDVSLDFDALQKAGSNFGSGGVIVLDQETDLVTVALNLAYFYAHESCGQCTPCREGTRWLRLILERIARGDGRPGDVDLLYDIADNIDGKTICALGEAAAWPQLALVRQFRDEFVAAVSRRPPATEAAP